MCVVEGERRGNGIWLSDKCDRGLNSPDLGGPGQPLGTGEPVSLGVLQWGRHHLIPLQGKGLSLQTVVIVILLLLFSGVIGLVGVPFIEGI